MKALLKESGIGIFSLVIGVFTMELALWVASPSIETIHESSDQSMFEPKEATNRLENSNQKTCLTNYVPVFYLGSELMCAKNTTPQLPKYGPPGKSWFQDGKFRIKESHLINSDACACLSNLPAYITPADSALREEPINIVVAKGRRVEIEKWVCEDSNCFVK